MDAFGVELNRLLVDTYRSVGKIEAIMLRDLSGGALSIAEMHAIESVGRGGREGRTITEISQELDITPPSVTAMMKRLEQKGFVTKQKGQRDARQVHIRLTEAGRRADIAHRWFHRKMVNAARTCVNEDEMDVLLRCVRGLNEFFRDKLETLEAEGYTDDAPISGEDKGE